MRPSIRRRLASIAVVVSVLVIGPRPGVVGASDACVDRLCAGAGKADMTPPIGTPMGGFFSRSAVSGAGDWAAQMQERGPDTNAYAKSFRQTEGIHTVLHARALVVQDPEGTRYAFASLENRGAPYEVHQAVVARLARLNAGISAERLMFSSTHSHSAPSPVNPYVAYGAISTDFFDPRVFHVIVDALTESIVRALDRLEPAAIGVGRVPLHGASSNRSLSAHKLNVSNHPADETATSPHAIDPIVTVLRAETADGDPIGAFYSFALHGTSIGGGNDLFSGDNMGPAMRVCEQELAARAPGRPAPVCAQASGAEGDVSPRADDASLHVHGDFAKAAATGGIVARGVLAAWDAAQVRDDITLDARFKILYFRGQDGDVGKPTSPVPMVGVGGNFGDGLGLPFDLPGSGDKIPVGVGAGGYPQYAPLQIVRVGNTALIAVPAEMTVEMARRVRTAVLAAVPEMLGYAAIIGLANSYLSYVTTPEEYAANLYEGAWTLYGPQQGNLLRNEYVRMAEDMAVGQPTDSIAAPPLGSNLALAEETSTEPDDPLRVGTVLAEPDDTPRGELVSFSWIGGNPGADRPRGRTFVRLQRLQPGGASTVATEDDIWSAIRVDRDPRPGAPYRWSARFDLPVDVPAGTYRIEVAGRYSALDHAGNYHVRSRDFVVEPAGALRVIAEVRNNGLGRQVRLTATWGAPTGERYAPRPKAFTGTGSVTYALRRGGEQLAAGTTPFGEWFDVDATITTVHIARGDIVTASGDTNAEQFELAIPD